MKYLIQDHDLIINDEKSKTVKFPSQIGEVLEFENCLIVRLKVIKKMSINENIFGVSLDGKILWQIKPRKYIDQISPYTGMAKDDHLVRIFNWSGELLWLEPKTGEILKTGYDK